MKMMKFEDCIIKSYPTGSRYICDPAPTDTDNDTVILVNGYYDWGSILLDDGWEDCGKEYAFPHSSIQFRAFRKGEENYIVTEEDDFYLSYIKATEGAKALNLLKKEDRIALFDAINSTTIDGYCGSGPQIRQEGPGWFIKEAYHEAGQPWLRNAHGADPLEFEQFVVKRQNDLAYYDQFDEAAPF